MPSGAACASCSATGPFLFERGVEAVLLFQQLDLLVRARAADHPSGALQFGDLTDLAADRARGARDEDRVALLDLREPGQPDVRGEAGDAEHTQVGGQRRQVRVHLLSDRRVEYGVVAPAEGVYHVVAGGEAFGVGCQDAADRGAVHRPADLVGLDVGLLVAHAAAHVGVDRQVLVGDQ